LEETQVEFGTSARHDGPNLGGTALHLHPEARRLAKARRLELANEEPEYFRIYGLIEDEWESSYASALGSSFVQESGGDSNNQVT
jgi:hypothetical protein